LPLDLLAAEALADHVELIERRIIERDRSAFRDPVPAIGRPRLVSEEEALRLFPPVWDRVRPTSPGMATRSPSWWKHRRLYDQRAVMMKALTKEYFKHNQVKMLDGSDPVLD